MAKTKTMKKAAKPVKLTPSAKPRKKSELYNILAEHTELSRKQVAAVFEALGKVMAVDLAKPGDGPFDNLQRHVPSRPMGETISRSIRPVHCLLARGSESAVRRES